MQLGDFDYELPEGRIAVRPLEPRHNARLLLSRPEGLADHAVRDLPDLLTENDILVLNDTRVIPARLFGMRESVPVEILLHRARPDGSWEAFAKPMKRLRPSDCLVFADGFSARVQGRHEDRIVLEFETGPRSLGECLQAHGHMPLPHYMDRADDAADRVSYQTIFADKDGAVAAPTASLHFTPELMDRLAARGIRHTFVTLHVGAGTFQPVRVDNIRDHVMHAEWAEVSPETAAMLNQTRQRGGRIVAVGTTVTRTLESAATTGTIRPFAGDTDIFITPGFKFRAVDALMTNFHLPKSTLLMLVAAFIGLERARAVYRHAIEGNYRFYSYGDSSLLFPAP